MATPSVLELTGAYNNADATSYAVASTSPAANSFLVLFYATRHGTTSPGATPAAVFGGSWVNTEPVQVDGVSAIGTWTMQLGASPGSAGFNLVMDGGVTAIGASWHLLQITDHDPSGTVVQSPIAATGQTGATGTVTFAAPGSATNLFIARFIHRGNTASTPEASWTAGTDRLGSTPNHGSRAEWRAAVDTTATMTWTSVRWQGSGLEIKELVAGGTPKLYIPLVRKNHLGQMVGRA
jgi:hypothetical protein